MTSDFNKKLQSNFSTAANKIQQNRAELRQAKVMQISINFRAFAPNGGRKREVAYLRPKIGLKTISSGGVSSINNKTQ